MRKRTHYCTIAAYICHLANDETLAIHDAMRFMGVSERIRYKEQLAAECCDAALDDGDELVFD